MNNKPDSIWFRLIKLVLPKTKPLQSPVAETEEGRGTGPNTDVLKRLDENDPTYKCILDHAFVQFAGNLTTALDQTQTGEIRLRALDSAVSLQRFIEDIEARRQGWNEERRREIAEEQKARAAQRAKTK